MRSLLRSLHPTQSIVPSSVSAATFRFFCEPTKILLASAVPLSSSNPQHPNVHPTTPASTPPSSSSVSAAAALYKSSRSRGRGLPPSNKNAVPSAPSAATSKQGMPATTSAAPSAAAAADISCATELPAETRPLTALQKRQLAMKDKKVFTLTSRAVDRVNLLLRLHNDQVDAAAVKTSGTSPLLSSSEDTNSSTNDDQSSAKNKRAVGIRIGVKKKGCSGYSYTVNYEFDEAKLKLKTGGDALVDAMINSTRGGAPSSSNSSSAGGGKSSSPANNSSPSDVHVDQDGVHIFVEGQALFYVIGTVMDYSVSNVEEKFTFQNPNQAHSCGCGESFMPFGV